MASALSIPFFIPTLVILQELKTMDSEYREFIKRQQEAIKGTILLWDLGNRPQARAQIEQGRCTSCQALPKPCDD
jgi:hypothetical protein